MRHTSSILLALAGTVAAGPSLNGPWVRKAFFPTGGNGATSTEVLTTYTTVTTCPVTVTSTDGPAPTVVTKQTTLTLTVTSCVDSCSKGAQPTIPEVTPEPPVITLTPVPTEGKPPGTYTSVVPTTVTVTKFVPKSKPVGGNGDTTVYSTWLDYTTTIFETECPTTYTVGPDAPKPSTVTITVGKSTKSEEPKPSTSTSTKTYSSSSSSSSGCPEPTTVTKTVTLVVVKTPSPDTPSPSAYTTTITTDGYESSSSSSSSSKSSDYPSPKPQPYARRVVRGRAVAAAEEQ